MKISLAEESAFLGDEMRLFIRLSPWFLYQHGGSARKLCVCHVRRDIWFSQEEGKQTNINVLWVFRMYTLKTTNCLRFILVTEELRFKVIV